MTFSLIKLFQKFSPKTDESSHSTVSEEEKGALFSLQTVSKTLQLFLANQQDILGRTDSEFLNLGQDMQTLYGKISDFTLKTQKSAQIIGGNNDESILHRLGLSIKDSLNSLEVCEDKIGTNLIHIKGLTRQLHDFYLMCPILERIGQYLRTIGLNMCVECSLSPEASRLFTVNANEIKKFSEKVLTITEMLQEDSAVARTELLTAQRKIALDLGEMQALSYSVAQIIKNAFHKIEDLIQISLDSMEQADKRSQKISRQVGEIVVAIQFHDNMSQRLEHVHDSLNDAVQRCLTGAEDRNSKDQANSTLTDVRAIVALQAGQVKEIIKGIDEAFQQNNDAFCQIGNEVDSLSALLTAQTTDPHQNINLAGKSENPFTALQAAIDQLPPLLDKASEQAGQMQDTIDQSPEAAGRLLRHIDKVRDIRHETLIKALNSIVKACRLGSKGRTITVLAEEMKQLSDQSDGFVRDMECIHAQITQSIRTLQEQTRQELTTDLGRASLNQDIEETSQSYNRFNSGLNAALEQSREIKEIIRRVSGDLDFLPKLSAALNHNLRHFDDLLESLSPLAADPNPEAQTDAEELAARYTMDQERLVHEKIFGTADQSFEISANTSDQNESLPLTTDDFDNIELFDSSTDDAIENNTELDARPSNDSHNDQNKEKEEDLGDNVELF